MRNGTSLDHHFELAILRPWSINGATQQIDASDGLTPAADLRRWADRLGHMKLYERKWPKMNKSLVGGVTVELLMGVVAPIMGISSTYIFLKMTFGFKFWLSFLIAVPLGTIIGWLVMISFIILIFKISQFLGSNSENSNLPNNRMHPRPWHKVFATAPTRKYFMSRSGWSSALGC